MCFLDDSHQDSRPGGGMKSRRGAADPVLWSDETFSQARSLSRPSMPVKGSGERFMPPDPARPWDPAGCSRNLLEVAHRA